MNPFREAIVASPWDESRSDVPEIHGQVFERCLEGVEHVRQQHRSAALLIHGEAGSGKTHLLSRLRRHLTPTQPSDTQRQECLYVWVRLQTSPRMIWRTLRRTLVEDWFRPVRGSHSQFQRILFHRLAQIRTAEGDLERWYDYMLAEVPEGLDQLMDQIADTLDLERNTAIAFKHMAFGRHMRDLRAWLGGTSLPQAALDRLDLTQDDGTDEEREDDARHVVIKLCQLAGAALPIVLSFDQVEALQLTPGDRDALFSFGQLISTLHDSTSNVLLISCVQSAFFDQLKDHARSADYDRMTSLGAVSLYPLSRPEALQLIAHRLAGTEYPVDGCWPLSQADFDELIAKGFVSPRKLLGLCAERFETRNQAAGTADGGLTTEAIAAFLQETWDALLPEKTTSSSPDRTEEIVRHGLPLLMRLQAPGTRLVTDDHLEDVPLIFETENTRWGLALCTQPNMNSLQAYLKRVKKQFALQRVGRLVLLRDPRIPLSKQAHVCRQLLQDLEQQGVVTVYPSTDTLAALDTFRELLSDAKAGDLSCHGQVVAPAAVESWLKLHLGQSLQEFLDALLHQTTATAPVEAHESDA